MMSSSMCWRCGIITPLAFIFFSTFGIATETKDANANQTPESPATAKIEDVNATKKRVDELGAKAKITILGSKLTELTILDGSLLTADDLVLFGRLTDLQKLQIYNCRLLNSETVSHLSGLKDLSSLALTNTVIDDDAVETIVKSFPKLIALDLSSNANMSSQVLKSITELTNLQQLSLLQNKFNDIGTRRLSKLQDLRVLDLRGNMQAGDMTLETIASLPKLKAFKHRSTAVSDNGMAYLSRNVTLENLLIQDFGISNQSGEHLAKLQKLTQLEIFRCPGFGSEGVLALKGLKLQRLTLRDLATVDDTAFEVLNDLPKLRRFYLHEISSVTDSGLKNLASLKELELLDIWSIPLMTDATIDVIAALPNLKELTIRSTAVTDKAIERLLAMPKLMSLTFKENGAVTEAALKKLSEKKWTKLDIGASFGNSSDD